MVCRMAVTNGWVDRLVKYFLFHYSQRWRYYEIHKEKREKYLSLLLLHSWDRQRAPEYTQERGVVVVVP
jgi:hypothetical protein